MSTDGRDGVELQQLVSREVTMVEGTGSQEGPSSRPENEIYRTFDSSREADPPISASLEILLDTCDIPFADHVPRYVQLKSKSDTVIYTKDPSSVYSVPSAPVLGARTNPKLPVQVVEGVCEELTKLYTKIITTSPSLNATLQKIRSFHPMRNTLNWNDLSAEIYRLINTCERVTPLINEIISAVVTVHKSTLSYDRCKHRLLAEFLNTQTLCQKLVKSFKYFLTTVPSCEEKDIHGMKKCLECSIDSLEEILLELETRTRKFKNMRVYPARSVYEEEVEDFEEPMSSMSVQNPQLSSAMDLRQQTWSRFRRCLPCSYVLLALALAIIIIAGFGITFAISYGDEKAISPAVKEYDDERHAG